MPPPVNAANAPRWLAVVEALANSILAGVHRIWGFQYSDNEEHYVYQIALTALTAQGIGFILRGGVGIGQDSDFICTRLTTLTRLNSDGTVITITSAAGSAAGDWPDAPFRLLIRHGGSDRQFSNDPVDAFATYGVNGGLPSIWAKPRLFERSTRIQVEATLVKNPAADWDIVLCFHGWKIYDASSLDLTRTAA